MRGVTFENCRGKLVYAMLAAVAAVSLATALTCAAPTLASAQEPGARPAATEQLAVDSSTDGEAREGSAQLQGTSGDEAQGGGAQLQLQGTAGNEAQGGNAQLQNAAGNEAQNGNAQLQNASGNEAQGGNNQLQGTAGNEAQNGNAQLQDTNGAEGNGTSGDNALNQNNTTGANGDSTNQNNTNNTNNTTSTNGAATNQNNTNTTGTSGSGSSNVDESSQSTGNPSTVSGSGNESGSSNSQSGTSQGSAGTSSSGAGSSSMQTNTDENGSNAGNSNASNKDIGSLPANITATSGDDAANQKPTETDANTNSKDAASDDNSSKNGAKTSGEADKDSADDESEKGSSQADAADDEPQEPHVTYIGGSNRYSTSARAALAAFENGTKGVVLLGSSYADATSATGLAGALGYAVLVTAPNQLPTATAKAIEQLGATEFIIAGGTNVVSSAVEKAVSKLGTVVRLSGDDRYGTNQAIIAYGQKRNLWKSDTVYVCSGQNAADALSLGPAAYKQGAAIVLVDPETGLSKQQLSTIASLKPKNVVIAGGTKAVPASSETKVKNTAPKATTTRLSGADRYETSYNVASWSVNKGLLSWDNIALVSGDSPWDALSISALQANGAAPLLLVSDQKQATQNFDKVAKAATIEHVTFVGGLSVVSQYVRKNALVAFGLATNAGDASFTAVRDASADQESFMLSRAVTYYTKPGGGTQAGTLKAGTIIAATPVDAAGGWLECTLDGQTVYIPRVFTWQGNHMAIGGDTRYDTMLKIALMAFPDGSQGAIVTSGESWADAISSSGLAGALEWPILYTDQQELSSQTKEAITTLGAKSIVIVGGTSAVSAAVEKQLKAISCVKTVERIAGSNRIQTANAVYKYGQDKDVWTGDALVVASSETFADALSASPVAYAMGAPLLLTDQKGLSAQAQKIIKDAAPGTVLVAGGSKAVPSKVDTWITGAIKDVKVTRLAGGNRFSTSGQVAQWGLENGVFDQQSVAIASGELPFDALAASPFLGSRGIPLLLGAANDNTQSMLDAYAKIASPQTELFLGGANATTRALRRMAAESFGNGDELANVDERYVVHSDSSEYTWHAIAGDTKVYALPTEGSAVLDTFAQGFFFRAKFYDDGGLWLVTTLNGRVVYLPSIYTEATAPRNSTDTTKYYGTSLGQTVYLFGNENAPELGTIAKGTKVSYQHMDRDGEWLKVTYKGKVGYIRNTGFVVRDSLRVQLENIVRTSGSLRNCFEYTSSHDNFTYITRETMPSWNNWQQDYAEQMLSSHGGNCHSFAALFYLLADMKGEDAKTISGYVRLRGGGMGPHGWVEIYRNGITYVCDPEGHFEAPQYPMYMMTYGNTTFHYA